MWSFTYAKIPLFHWCFPGSFFLQNTSEELIKKTLRKIASEHMKQKIWYLDSTWNTFLPSQPATQILSTKSLLQAKHFHFTNTFITNVTLAKNMMVFIFSKLSTKNFCMMSWIKNLPVFVSILISSGSSFLFKVSNVLGECSIISTIVLNFIL